MNRRPGNLVRSRKVLGTRQGSRGHGCQLGSGREGKSRATLPAIRPGPTIPQRMDSGMSISTSVAPGQRHPGIGEPSVQVMPVLGKSVDGRNRPANGEFCCGGG